MPPAVSCPDRAMLERLLLGQLSAPDETTVGHHVQGCVNCRAAVIELVADDTVVEAIRAREKPAPGKQTDFVLQLIAGLRASANPPPAVPVVSSMGVDAPTYLAPSDSVDEIGRIGEYRVLRVLGKGWMGMVYEGEDVRLKRRVALKVLKPEIAENDDARHRFLREAQAAAKVKSDHIVTIYQVGEAQGTPYLAMEFLHGEAMDHWLKRGRRPNVTQVLKMARELALGLSAAHERGLVHRDIKPGNIWLEAPTGRIKILDFGLARAARDDIHLTRQGAIVGTPAYMSPEQARGDVVDHRSDLFSLGCVLYRLTTGQMPFRGDSTMAILTALATAQPKPIRTLSPEMPQPLADLIERLLAKDPAQRPATARIVVQTLESIKQTLTSPSTPPLAIPVSTPVATPFVETSQTAPMPVAQPISVPSPPPTVTAPVAPTGRRAKRWGKRHFPAALAVAILGGLLIGALISRLGGKEATAPPPDQPTSIYAAAIAPEDRYPEWQPPGLVAILGDHRVRHAGAISLMALSPSAKWVATVYNNQLFVSNAETLHVDKRLSMEGSPITCIAWSADSKTIAAGRADDPGVVQIWDAPDWKLRKPLLLGKGQIIALAVTPDGKSIATVARDEKSVKLWSIESGKETRLFEGYPAPILVIKFTADGSELLVAGGPPATWRHATAAGARTGNDGARRLWCGSRVGEGKVQESIDSLLRFSSPEAHALT